MSSLSERKRLFGHYSLFPSAYLSLFLMVVLMGFSSVKAHAADVINYEIPAGPLGEALTQFGAQSGLLLSFDPAITSNKNSDGLKGRFTAPEGLQRLLVGTGLDYRFVDAGTVTLARKVVGQDGDGTLELEAITVQGLVAEEGRVGLFGERKIRDIPFSITAYTETIIENQQARTIRDVLENDSSVRPNTTANSEIDQFVIRGFPVLNAEVAVEGLFGLLPSRQTGIEAFERVEVFRGPNALLNGVPPLGNIGGLINMVPKRATDDPITNLALNYESEQNVGAHLDVGRRFGEGQRFGVRFNGAVRDGELEIDHTGREYNLAALALDYRGDRLRANLDVFYQSSDHDGTFFFPDISPGIDVPDAPNNKTNPSGQPWAVFESEFRRISGGIEYDITDDWAIFGRAGASRNEEEFRSFLTGTVVNMAGDTTGDRAFRQPGQIDYLTFDVGARGFFRTGPIDHELTIAANWLEQDLKSTFTAFGATFSSNLYEPIQIPKPEFSLAPSDPQRIAEREFTSFAIADTLSILDGQFQATLGLRYQDLIVRRFQGGVFDSENTASELTPAVGLVYKPSEPWSVYASFSQGLTPGPFAPGGVANAGTVFDPFVSDQYELGVKAEFDRFGASAALFQVTQPFSFADPSTNLFVVDGEIRNRGLELNLYGNVAQSLRLLGGVTFMNGEQTATAGGLNDGNKAIGIPEIQLNLYGEYDLASVPGLALNARVVYTDDQFLDPGNQQSIPDWTRLDLGASYEFKIGGTPTTVNLDITNVTDEDYWQSTGRGFLSAGAPRTILLTTTFEF